MNIVIIGIAIVIGVTLQRPSGGAGRILNTLYVYV